MQITMNTSTSVVQCLDMALEDFIQFFEDLCSEADKMQYAADKGR